MSQPPHTVAVIGCGSIGERHIRTLLATGRTRVVACDTRKELLATIGERYKVTTASQWPEILSRGDVTAVLIATPAPLHVPMALEALGANKHVLCEKPLSIGEAGVADLLAKAASAGRFTAVAYVLHFVPALLAARQFLANSPFGPLRHVTVNSGQHFPQFRPAYRDIYYRDHAQGGGAIQDALTHMANAVEWVAGPTKSLFCDASHQVLEGVTVEDTVNVVARNGEALVAYAMNQFQAPNETRWDFHGETGSVRVELHAQRWGTQVRGAVDWSWTPAPVAERDQLFVAQAHAFLDGCEGKPTVLCTLAEARQTLRFNLACLRSWKERRLIEL